MKFQSKFVKVLMMSFLFMLAVAACSPAGSGGEAEPDLDSGTSLDGTNWVLTQFGPEESLTAVLPDSSISLSFADGRISGSADCNTFFADATQSGDVLGFGPIGSTRMACPEPIMQQENAFLAAMASVSGYTSNDDQLTLYYDGGVLIFTAGTVAEADGQTEETKTLFVGPELVDCVGVGSQQCMQVKENAADEWTLFYDQIVGFEFEPGYEYELRVRETEIANPPADGSSIEVSLVEVVSKTAVSVTPISRPEGSNLQGTHWILTTFGPDDNQTAVLPNTELTLNFDGAQINGNAGCNSYFGEATINTDGSLEFSMMGSTLMACIDEAVMQQESDFLATLGKATSYTLAGNRLTLQTPEGSLEFVAASMHENRNEGAEVVDWETAVAILNSGEVVEIFQTHSLNVTLTLADGRTVQTVEPAIDDIFSAIDDCGEPCSNILMATE